ncbi:MAG: hypothetical protein ACI814_000474 [Mariniblastus sp.]|jgi:hypothetical protein
MNVFLSHVKIVWGTWWPLLRITFCNRFLGFPFGSRTVDQEPKLILGFSLEAKSVGAPERGAGIDWRLQAMKRGLMGSASRQVFRHFLTCRNF